MHISVELEWPCSVLFGTFLYHPAQFSLEGCSCRSKIDQKTIPKFGGVPKDLDIEVAIHEFEICQEVLNASYCRPPHSPCNPRIRVEDQYGVTRAGLELLGVYGSVVAEVDFFDDSQRGF